MLKENRGVRAGLRIVIQAAVAWSILLLVYHMATILRFNIFAKFTIPLVLLVPVFYSFATARRVTQFEKRAFSKSEIIPLALIAVLGCACLAFVIETGIIASLISRYETISFNELLDRRFYKGTTITVLGPVSFWIFGACSGALSAALITALVRRV